MMLRLLYISRIGPFVSRKDFARIEQEARRNNSERGITGFLYHDDRVFLQALEGLAADVDALFEAIRRDRRHGDVRLLSRRPIETRRFGGWAMGMRAGGTDAAPSLATIRPDIAETAGPGDAVALMRFLTDLSVGLEAGYVPGAGAGG
jgi:hypothetical protein